ncbi:MAG: hypothetical protein LAO20_08945 [Acidobacteriia bacterium]|nr:hypothetical protein [Terriglobia bacterium]
MPVTLPAGTEAWLAKQGGGNFVPVILADIQTLDGTQFFWSDMEGTYLSSLTGANQFYNGWIKGGFKFTCAKDFSTNAGDLVLQNISGNTINRDVALALQSHEFEGALCIVRLWLPLLDAVLDEFHCSMSEANPKEDEASNRLLQLFDPAQYDLAADIVSTLCILRYKSGLCGSTGSASVCNKLFATCQDANHAAQERFRAVLTTTANNLTVPPVGQGGGGGPIQQPDPVAGGREHNPLRG